MPKIIDSFTDKYHFLSNFYPCTIEYQRLDYPSVEHAYQAAKSKDQSVRLSIRDASSAKDAKRKGRRIKLRDDWEKIKLKVMLKLVRIKFQQPTLRKKLLATGDAVLIEGNWWGDKFWGVCNGAGENHLGKILMRVRDEAQE